MGCHLAVFVSLLRLLLLALQPLLALRGEVHQGGGTVLAVAEREPQRRL